MNDQKADRAERILADNVSLHNREGYAEFYDRFVGVISNPWERGIFSGHVDEMLARLREQCGDEPLTGLDLGAGTGNITLMLLERGVATTAVDISEGMLERLAEKARGVGKLEVMCGAADGLLEEMASAGRTFDIVTGCSFLHHLPDYLHTVELAGRVVKDGGFLYFAHEPMLNDTVTDLSRRMQWIDFKLWRLKTHVKRLVGAEAPDDVYWSPDCLADYWDLKEGCDQRRIAEVMEAAGLKTDVRLYDSKRSRALNSICRLMGTKTLFAVIGCGRHG